jgi:RHS repeat-associated protein
VTYTRDGLGRVTRKVETVGGVTTTWTYVYDAVGQLITVRRNGTVVESYTYDALGNRVAMDNDLTGRTWASGSTTYDGGHRLTRGGGTTYRYDADGRMASIGAGPVAALAYGTDGTLASVSLRDGREVTCDHDARGRRVARYVDGVRTHGWLYGEGQLPLVEVDGSGTVRSVFVYAAAPSGALGQSPRGWQGAVPVKAIRGGATYHIVSDHLGSPRLVVDAAGSVVRRIDYDSFGNVIADTNPAFDLPFGFAGGVADPAHELIRFGARDYLPSVGRWTARDPAFLAGGLNLYGYVGNDPINRVDRSGLQTGVELVIIVVLVVVAIVIAGAILGDNVCSFFRPDTSPATEAYQPFDPTTTTSEGGLIPGSLGGTLDTPVMTCQGTTCTIDYGSFVLPNIPADSNTVLETIGTEG